MPAVREAHAALTAAWGQLQALEDEGAALSGELDARRAGDGLLPPLPPHTASDRSGRPGAAFFQLVDFSPSLTERERAGLESALQGSGLLNAWVSADGHVTDPDLQDLIAAPEPPSPGEKDDETLLAALVPAPSPGCTVTPGTVTRLLASVRLADNPATSSPGGLVLSRTGRWRAGTLTGASRKDTAEHVGPAAREASRLRRIAVLDRPPGRMAGQARPPAAPRGDRRGEPGRLGSAREGLSPRHPPSRSRRACWQRQRTQRPRPSARRGTGPAPTRQPTEPGRRSTASSRAVPAGPACPRPARRSPSGSGKSGSPSPRPPH